MKKVFCRRCGILPKLGAVLVPLRREKIPVTKTFVQSHCHISDTAVLHTVFVFFYLLLSILLFTPFLYANENAVEEALSWHLEADTLDTLADNTIAEARGNVVLTRGEDRLSADFVRYYTATGWIYLKGNVSARIGGDTLQSESAEFNLNTRTGWCDSGRLFFADSHLYLAGDHIARHIGDRYSFLNAKVTTCDGPIPAWSMNAERADVEIDGYAKLYGTSFDVKNNGVMYAPFMVLPAKASRQSGLLLPHYGISSKRGVFFTQPYFYVLDESRDMTFYGGWMEKVGPLISAEYRAHPAADQKSWFAFTGIYDSHTVTRPGDSKVYRSSSLLRTNNNRFWLRGMSDGLLGEGGWHYRSNIDYVSDQEFLREFQQGPTGFDYSRKELFNLFGRYLPEKDQNRVNALLLYKDWERFGFVAGVRYEQDPALGHGNQTHSQDLIAQRLPELNAFLYKGRIFQDFPLEAEASFQTGYFHREKGTRGFRTEIHPSLTLPLDFGYGSLITSVGLRQTAYHTNTSGRTVLIGADYAESGSAQTGRSRSVLDVDAQGYTEASRIWKIDHQPLQAVPENAGRTVMTGVRHVLQPRIHYKLRPGIDQSDNPFYTRDDRIPAANELTYSITNIVTTRSERVAVRKEKGRQIAEKQTVYRDLLRWHLETGYDFEEADRTQHRDLYARRPFMDLYSELEYYPLDWLGYSSKTYLSMYDGSVTRHDHDLVLRYDELAEWQFGLDFRDRDYEYRHKFRDSDRDDIRLSSSMRLLHNKVILNLTKNWSVAFEDYRNMRVGGTFGKTYDQSVDISYADQCYRIIGRYKYDGYDSSFTLFVQIPGLFE
ncbi:MAG: LPS assembly protein LptD [Desulfovibrionaceae bacterium]|nr:LPS assembly protein LptD [Desulfovibrionaceae bacterium]